MTEETKRPKLVLIDGSNYLFRAFYAIRELSNSKGFPTNAIYGFTTMLMKLLREQAPDCVAVAFDVKGPTFRHEAYAEYKATRRAVPETLIPQIPFVKEVVRGLNIPILEQQGLEADDIIGTIASRQAAAGMDVIIVSGDKDMMQLVSDRIIMVDTMKDKTYDRAAVKERFGVPPDKVVEILALTGDLSDNIPGVPGIGPKGASRLVAQFGGVEGILAHPEKIYNQRTREAILQNAEKARLSRELAQIRTDAEFAFDIDACHRREPDREKLVALFKEFEFSTLLQELRVGGETGADHRIVSTPEELAALVARLGGASEFSLDLLLTEAEPMRAAAVGLAFCPAPGEAYYLPVGHSDGEPQLSTAAALEALAPHPCRPRKGEARPRPQDNADRLSGKRRPPCGAGVRYDGGLVPAQPGQTWVRAGRHGPRPPGAADPGGKGGGGERGQGRLLCRDHCGKGGRLRLPPRRCGGRSRRRPFSQDRRCGDGRALP